MVYSDTISKGALAIAVVAVIVATTAMIVVFTGDDGSAGEERHVIYIGLDPGIDEDSIVSIEDYVKELVTDGYHTGYTMYRADGGYSADGTVTECPTIVVILLDVSSSQVESMVESIKEQNGVSAVTTETYTSQVSFS